MIEGIVRCFFHTREGGREGGVAGPCVSNSIIHSLQIVQAFTSIFMGYHTRTSWRGHLFRSTKASLNYGQPRGDLQSVFVCLFGMSFAFLSSIYRMLSYAVSLGGTLIRCRVLIPIWAGIISCQPQIVSDLNIFET